MRILAMSDTHDSHAWWTARKLPEADVFVHAGDITWRGELGIIMDFSQWLGALPYKNKLVIAGNHDLCFEANARRHSGEKAPYPNRKRKKALAYLEKAGITYLEDSGIEIDGIKFWGTPWQPHFCDWGFNVQSVELRAQKFSQIPDDTDVLITHTPPRGHCDGDDEGYGDVALLHRIRQIKPKLNICGHAHEGHGFSEITHSEDYYLKTLVANAASLDRDYQAKQPPLLITVKDEGLEWEAVWFEEEA